MNWPTFKTDPMTPHQVEQLSLATSGGNLAVFGGSPGTGKSFVAAQVIRAFGSKIGWDKIAVAAPTGKAAVRLSEAMHAYNIPLRAVTWHSLLKVQQAGDEGWFFEFNYGNPLPHTLLVGDEMSMLDVDLGASVFGARGRSAKFLIIGDVNQLPPVGHGAPLRDLIRSGLVPYGELREIIRNEGGIVQACADIRDGKEFQCTGNLRHVPARGPEETKDELLTTIDTAAHAFGVDAVWDCQVLVAVNKKGELCRRKINLLLQATLNKNPEIKNTPFRLGDKVVCLKNGWFRLSEMHRARTGESLTMDDRGERAYVANGELGEAIRVEPKVMHVRLSSPNRVVIVPRGQEDPRDNGGEEDDDSPGTGCNWDLGYALSVHKSQGSEWPVAIVVVDESGGAGQVCSREWIYTAISRAKQCCYLVGPLHVAQNFVRRTAIDKRKTFLAERICELSREL